MFNKILKKLINRDLKFYRKEEEQKIREELIKTKEDAVVDAKNYEHEWHSQREERETKIAFLDAKIDGRQEKLDFMEEVSKLLLAEKDSEIKRLEGILKKIGGVNVIK